MPAVAAAGEHAVRVLFHARDYRPAGSRPNLQSYLTGLRPRRRPDPRCRATYSRIAKRTARGRASDACTLITTASTKRPAGDSGVPEYLVPDKSQHHTS